MKKKMIAVLLACALTAGMTAGPTGLVTVQAEGEQVKTTENGLTYQEIGDGIGITDYIGTATEVVIPESIDGKKVTRIEPSAFMYCSSLTSISIPAGVTNIGSYAFCGCSGLTSVSIPTGVTCIENMTFTGCSDLTSVSIPEGVTSIGDQAFSGCSSLTNVSIPEGVTSIGNHAFSSCSGLTSVSIPEGVTSIGDYAFMQCSSLTSVHISAGVTSIGKDLFWDCSSLTNISVAGANDVYKSEDGILYNKEKTMLIACPEGKTGSVDIPAGITNIGAKAFSRCSGLTSVRIPAGVTSIGESAFEDCYGLTSISIPEEVISIGDFAFCGCSNLTSVRIPAGVTNIGTRAFGGCRDMISIYVAEKNETYKSEDGVLYNKEKTILLACPGGKEGFMRIPAGVEIIEENAFYGCSGLTSVSIPKELTRIVNWVFNSCASLKDVYYAGSFEQWRQIMIWGDPNDYGGDSMGEFIDIHYNSDGPEIAEKTAQIITAGNITKTYGEKAFSLGAKSSGNGTLSYAVSNPKVATVDGTGKVTIHGCGITDITITAAETNLYVKAQKMIKMTVKPQKMTLKSVKSNKRRTVTVKWKKDETASGYLIECATDKKFKKNKVQATIGKNKKVSENMKKLKAGKKYYVRICAYAQSDNVKVQGDWSKVKTVKVKK